MQVRSFEIYIHNQIVYLITYTFLSWQEYWQRKEKKY